MDEPVVAWLLDGDVAVRFRTGRDLLGRPDAALQERIALEGDGAALLAASGGEGHWGRGFYQPKWTSSHYTLLELRTMGVSPLEPRPREVVRSILRSEKGRDGGLNPATTVRTSDVCLNAMALNYCAYFGAKQEDLESVVDLLLRERLPDGGVNCRSNRDGARHSSVHTTVSLVEAVTEYQRSGYRYRLDELRTARATAVEFLLRHRLYRSERTGEVMNAEFTRLHHPARWHFDVLRGLEALVDAGVPQDPRMQDAVDVLLSRRMPDGRWAANRPYPGETHLPPVRPGEPSRWVTLSALRVLNAYGAQQR